MPWHCDIWHYNIQLYAPEGNYEKCWKILKYSFMSKKYLYPVTFSSMAFGWMSLKVIMKSAERYSNIQLCLFHLATLLNMIIDKLMRHSALRWLSFNCADGDYAECSHADCRCAECRYVQCRSTHFLYFNTLIFLTAFCTRRAGSVKVFTPIIFVFLVVT